MVAIRTSPYLPSIITAIATLLVRYWHEVKQGSVPTDRLSGRKRTPGGK